MQRLTADPCGDANDRDARITHQGTNRYLTDYSSADPYEKLVKSLSGAARCMSGCLFGQTSHDDVNDNSIPPVQHGLL